MKPVNGRGGNRAFPTENRSNPSPEWNKYRIECRDGEVSLAVNGKVVTCGTDCIPRKGYICVESEGGVVHYRNMRIKELPDTDIAQEHIATANRNFRVLYNGVDLKNWKVDGNWKTQNWVLAFAGTETGSITTHESLEDVGFVFDVSRKQPEAIATFEIRGVKIEIDANDKVIGPQLAKNWNRFEGEVRDGKLTLLVNGKKVLDAIAVESADSGPVRISAAAPVDFANIYVRELK